MKICMIAGDNSHYIHSLVQALASIGLKIELIGGDPNEKFEYSPLVKFINLRGSQDPNVSLLTKLNRIFRYYFRCLSYMRKSDIQIIHIHELRLIFVEGIILFSIYKLIGKKIVYTAHNLQPKEKNSKLNRLLFFLVYRKVNHIICHTIRLKSMLCSRYRIHNDKVSVVQHGLNCSVPITHLSQVEARHRIGIKPNTKVMLLFGGIGAYKGYEIALRSLKYIQDSTDQITLIVAGGPYRNNPNYLQKLKQYVDEEGLKSSVQFFIRIPDQEVELFFEAADVLLLPYIEGDFQSGVLFLAYSFGLPVIASDVGSFPEEIENGVCGYIFRSKDPIDLAKKIHQFYQELYQQPNVRQHIRQYAMEKYNWTQIAKTNLEVYQRLVNHKLT